MTLHRTSSRWPAGPPRQYFVVKYFLHQTQLISISISGGPLPLKINSKISLPSFETWRWRRMEKTKWSEKVTNERQLCWSSSKEKLPPSWYHSRTDDRSEGSRKKVFDDLKHIINEEAENRKRLKRKSIARTVEIPGSPDLTYFLMEKICTIE